MHLEKTNINHADMMLNSELTLKTQKKTSDTILKSMAQCQVADKKPPKCLACLEKLVRLSLGTEST